MENIKLKFTRKSVITWSLVFVVLVLLVIQMSGSFSDEWQYRVDIATAVIVSIFFLVEMLFDIIKKKYTTIIYIVILEIVGIIAWVTFCYVSITMGNLTIYSNDYEPFVKYKIITQIILMVMIFVRLYLKSKRFKKNEDVESST